AVGLADTDEHIRGKLTGRKMALPPVVEHVILRHIRPRAWAVLGQHVCSVELINIHMAIRSLQRPSPSRACRNLFTFRACPKRVYAPRRTCRGQEPSFSPRACQRNSRPQLPRPKPPKPHSQPLAHIMPSSSPAPAIPSAEAPSGMCPSCPCCGFRRRRSSPASARRWWLWIGCTQHGPLCCSTPQDRRWGTT